MVFQLDIHKAYDTVSWAFLRQVLLDFEVPSNSVEAWYCLS